MSTNHSLTAHNNIQKTLDRLSNRKKAPKYLYFILLALYIAATVVVKSSAKSQASIMIGDVSLSVYVFSGVFSSLANICLILITVLFGKTGFVTSMAAMAIQMPIILINVFLRHNWNSLPGVFGNLLVIIAVLVIRLNNKQIIKHQEELKEQALHDAMTGLPNRYACRQLVYALKDHKEKFVLVSIDVNNFKNINDTMGFDAGNEVLIQIASRWKAIADDGSTGTLDFIARMGGDEYAIVIREFNSDEEVLNTIRRYDASLKEKITVDGCDLGITAGFGYAYYPEDCSSRHDILTFANAAVAEIKRINSSSHILRFHPNMLKTERTLEVEQKLRTALENDTVYFNLQPQFDMQHKLRGFEALARMKDEEGNFISPGEFIPVAEKVGLVDKVDGTVFRKAAIFFGGMLRKSGLDLMLSVNVSVRHLMKNDFLDEVRSVLKESGVPAKNLEIEITESIMIDSVDKALEVIADIENMGIQIAIDDFGTGYSSLSYLNRFPANLLKIDKSFIDKMNTNESSKQYVAAIISIGHIMGFDVISEGVENDEQLKTLEEIGCDYIQGYVWGRPLPMEEAEKVVMAAVKEEG